MRSHRTILDIEALRGIAVLLIMVGHLPWFWSTPDMAWVRALLRHSWVGVDLFLAISGFVIARSIIASGGIRGQMVAFWIRRIFRIQPLVISWLLIGIVCTLIYNKHGFFGTLTWNALDAAAALLQVYNVYVVYLSVMWQQPTGIFGNLWSLSLEEQFYFLLPFILLLPKRISIAVLILGAIIQLPLTRPPSSPLWAFRFDALFLGVLLAMIPLPVLRSSLLKRLSVPLTMLFIVSLYLLAWQSPHLPTTGVIAILSVGIVALASMDQGYILGDGRCRDVIAWIGSRSFGLYLAHPVCYRIATELCASKSVPTSNWNLTYVFTALFITFGLTEILYRCVEVPARLYGKCLSDFRRRDNLARATIDGHLRGVARNEA